MTERTNKASGKHLTHKHAPYHGCTVLEVVIIAAINIVLALVLSLILSLIIGYMAPIMIVMFLLSLSCIKPSATRLGEFKKNKPEGYVYLRLMAFINKISGQQGRLIELTTVWTKRKSL